jgi:glycosyltransferase involved in cell wall biosynthesis
VPVEPLRVGYILKMYPRYSETFVVNEILALERAGVAIEIFSLRPPVDTHFQDAIARVRAPVTYVGAERPKMEDLWTAISHATSRRPEMWDQLPCAAADDARDVYQASVLAAAAHDRGLQHFHAHFGTVATTVARLAARFAGLPYTFTAHAKDIFHESTRRDELERKLRDAAGVVTVSDYNVSYLRGEYGSAAAGVQRIYNGIDLEAFSYSAPMNRRARILGIGRLVEKKGFTDLVQACARLAAQGRAVDCRIIGAGALEADLRAQAARLGVHGSVVFLGPRPQSEIVREMAQASVCVAPCVRGSDGNRDGLPTVLLEAMALGTPCVATPVTGIPEVVHDGITGLLVPEHDPDALAVAIGRLLDDGELRCRLARNARALIEREFDIDRNTARLRALFSSVAASPTVFAEAG